jgi:hypothetical protein
VPILAWLVLALIGAFATPALSRRRSWQTGSLLVNAAILLVLAVATTIYVAGEDDYRRDGRSRWTVYDAHVITVVAITAAIVAATVALLALRRRRLAWAAPLVEVVAVMLGYAALVQMTN